MSSVLTIQDLHKVYKSGTHALKGINLTVEKGDFFALLGPNGAGKSTTIGIFSSLVRKSSGKVIVNGYDLDKQPVHARREMGVVAQEVNIGIFEIVENVLLYQAGYFGVPLREAKRRAEALLKQLNLWEKRKQKVQALSGGMKRRLMIATAMMHYPTLLILDEPTAGVDLELRRGLYEYLREINRQGTTIILTTHYLEEAESLCNRIAIINHGELVLNIPKSELTSQLSKQIYRFELSSDVGLVMSHVKVSPNEIEVEVDAQHTLNDVFDALTRQGIKVHSVTPTTNRLERLFIEQTGGK